MPGSVEGTAGDDGMGPGYADGLGNQIDGADGLNDVINGNAGNDGISAGLGNDSVFGGTGNDTILGEDGNDSLSGAAGNDQLYGGEGADTLLGDADRDSFYSGANDVVDGGEAGDDQDTLYLTDVASVSYGGGTDEAGTILFADGSTMLFSNIERLVLNGGNPDGIIWGTSGADSIGAGYVDQTGDVIDAGDAVFAGAGPDDDEVFAQEGNDSVASGAGRDNVYGGEGDDRIATGTGNDYAQGDPGNDAVAGQEGDDFLRGDAGNDSVYGGTGNDSTYGGADNDSVYGGDGDDQMFGGFGVDTVYGGAGNDTITGSGGDDIVYGEAGDDSIQGSNGADTLYGGAGSDTLLGEEDADSFYAGSGDAVDGYESVTTGTDNDTLYVADVQSVIFDTLNPETGTVQFSDGGSLAFYNIENLFVDGVLTRPLEDVVEGGGGEDLIDTAYSGDPQGDRIDAADNAAGSNDDVVQAYGGNDTVVAGQGDDLVYGGDGRDAMSGEAGNDSLSGDAGDDTLFGGAGDDTLFGGAGADAIKGGDGDDRLLAGDGDDSLYGGAGNDSFDSGAGADVSEGGDDRDSFLGGIGDTVDGGDGGDNIDTLDLRAFGKTATNIIYAGADRQDGTVEFLDGSGSVMGRMSFANIETVIPCFAPGAMITTDRGEVAVEQIVAGSRLLTRDGGFQPVRWIGRRDLEAQALRDQPAFNPVHIARGALGRGLPLADMIVSPQHRLLITGPRAEMLFGEPEVLAAAVHLVGQRGVTRLAPESVSYLHLLCDRHEIIRANGSWTESFQPGEMMLNGMDGGQRAELVSLFPELRAGRIFPAARLSLKAHEAEVLRLQH